MTDLQPLSIYSLIKACLSDDISILSTSALNEWLEIARMIKNMC